RRAFGMERELGIKLMRALVDAGFIAEDQRADATIEKVALEAGLNREQLKAALKYAREHKWVAETNKASWCIVTPQSRTSSEGLGCGRERAEMFVTRTARKGSH